MPPRYLAAACQTDFPNPTDRSGIPDRVSQMLAMIDRAVIGYAPFGDVRLVVFPEFAHAAPVYATVEELADKLAVPVPNEHTDRYHKKAKEHGVYIQTGHVPGSRPDVPRARLQHHLPDRPGRAAVQVPQGPPVGAVGGPRQPARPAGLRRAAVPGGRDGDRRHRLRDLLRLAVPRGDPRAGPPGGGGAGPRVGVHGPVGRDAADGLVDGGEPLPGAGEPRLRRGREPGGEAGALPAVHLAGREHGRGLRRPHPRPGRPGAGGEDRRRPDRPGRPAGGAGPAGRPPHARPPADRGVPPRPPAGLPGRPGGRGAAHASRGTSGRPPTASGGGRGDLNLSRVPIASPETEPESRPVSTPTISFRRSSRSRPDRRRRRRSHTSPRTPSRRP